ncbi:MAG: tetratricopeptide repeat protein [Nanoarchaeota archaeon]
MGNWIIDNMWMIGVTIVVIVGVIANWFRTKQLKKTAEIYEEAIKEEEKNNPQFYYDSAITYMEIRQKEKAINRIKEFINLFPENPAIKDATEVLEKMKRKFYTPPDGWTYYYLGEVYRRKGDIEKAKVLFKEQLKRDPNANVALYGLGIIHARDGNREEGIKHLERFLQLPGADKRAELHQKREMNAKIALRELKDKGIYTSSENKGQKAEKLLLIIFSFLLIGGIIFFLGFVIYQLILR